jgi:hypothetical protein
LFLFLRKIYTNGSTYFEYLSLWITKARDDRLVKNLTKKFFFEKIYFYIIKTSKMISFLDRDEFNKQVTADIERFCYRNIENIGKFHKKDFVKKIDQYFGKDQVISRKAEEISQSTKLNMETVELILRASLEFSYNNYLVDIKRIERENADLRRELRKSRATESSNSKKASEQKSKERIELQEKTEKLNQLNQENRRLKNELSLLKKEGKKMNHDKEKDQQKMIQQRKKRGKSRDEKKKKEDNLLQKIYEIEQKEDDNPKREITFYDIPIRYSDKEVEKALRKIGQIKAISFKKQFKYQTIKTLMILDDLHDRFFRKETWKVDLIIGSEKKEKLIQARWFDGKMSVKDIKERCRWKAYKILHHSYMKDVALGKYNFEFGKNVYFNKKLVFLAYFKSEEEMLKARERSIELEKNDKDRIWIIHGSRKRKTNGNFVDTQKNGTSPSDDTRARSLIPASTTMKEKDSGVIKQHDLLDGAETTQVDVSTDKAVDIINSFCAGELEQWIEREEEKKREQEGKRKLKKDNVSTKKVVKIIRDLREDLYKEDTEKEKEEEFSLEQENMQEVMTESEKEHIQKVMEERAKIHTEVESDEVIRARLEKNKRRRAVSRELGEEIRSLEQIERGLIITKPKPISQAKFNYYNDVNQSCATRLAIVKLAEKAKKPAKKGRKKVSDDDDDSEEKEIIEIKVEDEMDEDNDGSYESRRRSKHTKKKRKQKSVMK